MFALTIKNYRTIRDLHWKAEGVCAVVGPNGSGCSSLLEVLNFFHIETWQAFREHMFNSLLYREVRAKGMKPEEKVTIQLQHPWWTWKACFQAGGQFFSPTEDQFNFPSSQCDAEQTRFRYYPYYDLARILGGEERGSWVELNRTGTNLAGVLATWNHRNDYKYRYDFVEQGMKELFPHLINKFLFGSNGLVILPPQQPTTSFHLNQYSHGFLFALLHLIAVASVQKHGIVALEMPEHSLHPVAIERLMELFREWSEAQDIDILLHTQSPVVLNAFKEEPEKILVFDATTPGYPKPLTEIKDPEWLAQFHLGELYTASIFGETQPVQDRDDGLTPLDQSELSTTWEK